MVNSTKRGGAFTITKMESVLHMHDLSFEYTSCTVVCRHQRRNVQGLRMKLCFGGTAKPTTTRPDVKIGVRGKGNLSRQNSWVSGVRGFCHREISVLPSLAHACSASGMHHYFHNSCPTEPRHLHVLMGHRTKRNSV
jgi:hypothetical protein